MKFEIKTNFNSQTFQRDLERMVVDAVKKNGQPMLDRLLRQCQGKPVAEVKRRLSSEWQRTMGGRLSESELTQYATLLSNGTRIVLKGR